MQLTIVSYGNPILKKKAKEIDINYKNIKNIKALIKDMFDTMYGAEGVGLAAPQVNISIRLFIVDASPYKKTEPELENFKKVFINPEIIDEWGDKWAFNEGCLSIPGIRENVYRLRNIRLRYFDENFNNKEETFTGIAARIIQHEYDHLEGILFIEKISPFRKRMIKNKLNNILKGKVEVKYPIRFPSHKNLTFTR